MNEWQIAKEVLLSVIKWFLIFVVVNNLIWLLIVLSSTSVDISNRIDQDGLTNNSEVTNGKA